MPSREVSTPENLEFTEAALIDTVRLILEGRSGDVPGLVRKLTTSRSRNKKVRLSDAARAELKLLLSESEISELKKSSTSAPSLRGSVESPSHEQSTPILSERDADQLQQIIREYRERDRLLATGLYPTRTILLSGPPGVGKTMSMVWLAGQLGHPLIRLESSDVIGSLLGESSRELSAVFRAAETQGAVLALDEVDALAKRRDDVHDVGEFKRFVSTLLLEIDRWTGPAPLIAATNHLDLLDPALERRFETHLHIGLPNEKTRQEIFASSSEHLALSPSRGVIDTVAAVTEGATGADIDRIVQKAARNSVLNNERIDQTLLVAAAPLHARDDRPAREKFAAAAQEHAGLTSRRIGELLGCSHTTAQRLAEAGANR